MAQNVTIAGASYSGVPAIDVPKSGGGTARFIDPAEINATLLTSLDSDFKAENIKKDVDLFGLIGTLEGGGGLSGFKKIYQGTIIPAEDITSDYTVQLGETISAWDMRNLVFIYFSDAVEHTFNKVSEWGGIAFNIATNQGASIGVYGSSSGSATRSSAVASKPAFAGSTITFTCTASRKLAANNVYHWLGIVLENEH